MQIRYSPSGALAGSGSVSVRINARHDHRRSENMDKNEEIDVSEFEVRKWLGQLGIPESETHYIGQKGNDGPPDFEVKYGGETVAIEVMLFNYDDGWGTAEEERFRRRLERMLREAGGDQAKGHGVAWYYQYSPGAPLPPIDDKTDSILKRRVEGAVAVVKENGIGEFQIDPDHKEVGDDGIVLHAFPLPLPGDFAVGSWGTNIGEIVEEGRPKERIKEIVQKKSAKVRKAKERRWRAKDYDNWWLVLVDRTNGMAGQFLGSEGKEALKKDVQDHRDIDVWNKIVLLNPFWNADTETNDTRLRFWPLWEDPSHPALPSPPQPMSPSMVIRPEASR